MLRTAPQAEESSASLSEEGSSCNQRLRIAAAAKQLHPRLRYYTLTYGTAAMLLFLIENGKYKGGLAANGLCFIPSFMKITLDWVTDIITR
jgi:hypothetical protein